MIDINTRKIILASKSPRRRDIFNNIGLTFGVAPSFADETIVEYQDYKDYVIKIARKKGEDIAQKFKESIVVASDTIVVKDDQILTKPQDKEDAYRMLKMLSGDWHSVFSSVYIIDGYLGKTIADAVETKVKFIDLSEEAIENYLNTEEPYDKAGAYGIQGKGAKFVEKIDGCFFGVVGFPVSLFVAKLAEMGYIV